MSQSLTLSLSESEMASLAEEATAAGTGVEEFARHVLSGKHMSQDPATVELGQLQSDLAQAVAGLGRLEQKLELVYQLCYFFGKKLATNPAEFHSFVAALKQRADQQKG
jgi:hypothetical protein